MYYILERADWFKGKYTTEYLVMFNHAFESKMVAFSCNKEAAEASLRLMKM